MRTSGICLALVATAQFALFSSPAFAADPPAPAPTTTTTTTTSTTTSTSTTDSSAASTDGTVMVHIKADKPVTLQRRSGESAAWETVCSSPCDQRAPVGDQYQVTGEGVNASKPFMLNASKGTVNLSVTVGDKSGATTGTIVLVAGGVLLVTGVIVMIAAGGNGGLTGQGNDSGTTHLGNTNAFFAGGALVFAGIAAGIYGGATLMNSAHSSVEGDVAKPGPARGAVDPGHTVAKNTTPTAPAFIFPVFQASF